MDKRCSSRSQLRPKRGSVTLAETLALPNAAGESVVLPAPAAQAQTLLGAAHDFCDVIGGSFTTEAFHGQTQSTCTFGYGAHHFYYSNGEFRSAD
jgi:hypothetical protein